MIYLESCIETLKKNNDYHYVLTSPPDYAELGIDPKTNEWEDFLDSWISLLNPINNLVQYVQLIESLMVKYIQNT